MTIPFPAPRSCAAVAFVLAMGACGPIAQADEVDACFNAAEQAQALHRQSKLRLARQQLETCTRNSCPRALRGDCKAWMAEVEVELAWLAVHVVDSTGQELADARIQVDGQGVTADGVAIEMDPGEHVVHVERSDSAPNDKHITLRDGERSRVSITLLPSRPVAPRTPATNSKLELRPAPPYRREEASHAVPASAWALGGVALTSLGATAALWIVGTNERSELAAGCGVTHSCSQSEVNASHDKLLVGDITAGVGLLALGVATWITLASWDKKPVAQVRLGTVRGGAMGVVESRF